MSIVRATQAVAVEHPESGTPVPVLKDQPFEHDDPLVRAYPWLFTDDQPIERADARPGERRQR